MFETKYANLNEEQKQAVDTIDGPVLVVAGPGSGKTELLSLRTLNILKETDLPPSSILCLTFTDSATINMQNRLADMMGSEAYKITVSTFHSFGTEIINRYPDYFYKGATYKPVDELTSVIILEDILSTLPYGNPLGSFSDDHGYAFLKDVKEQIGNLKKGGLDPENFKKIIESNSDYLNKSSEIITQFFENYSFRDRKKEKVDKVLSAFSDFIGQLREIPVDESAFVLGYRSIKDVLLDSMEFFHGEALEAEKLSPLTVWRKDFTCQDVRGYRVFKDYLLLEKNFALAEVYALYQKELHKRGYFDYDDMILDVCDAIEKNPVLKFNLQEQYQYILVDEFQDTNAGQMRLLNNLLDADVHEGRPNILAVGDDDQSIYKFQGANLGNILDFNKIFRDPQVVVLTKNYRSNQEILNFIRKIIRKGSDRLENRWSQITKELVAANKDVKDGEIAVRSFSTEFEEFLSIAVDIKKRMDAGENPEEIAVIATRHKKLEEISKYLDHFGIPVSYERKRNILNQKHIMEIMNILKLVSFLNKSALAEVDALLPEILSYEFFGISRFDIWKISMESYARRGQERKKFWLEVMKEYPNEKVNKIADFFIHIAGMLGEWTAEEIIDCITGIKPVVFEDGEEYFSPYKNFYFSDEKFKNDKGEFMDFLKALRGFVVKVREFRGGKEVIMVPDLLDLLSLYETHKLSFSYKNAFDNSEKAVTLTTVHGVKGLEFETVYVVGCNDKIWFSKGGSGKIHFPLNIPLSPSDDKEDDKLRLFYVALSRAKRNLYITYHEYKDDGGGLTALRFLKEDDIEEKPEPVSPKEILNINSNLADQMGAKAFHDIKFNPVRVVKNSDKENAFLKDILKNYKLTATHLNNFLNLKYAGPALFFEKNLLRFPQKLSPTMSYGNAVHKTLERTQRDFANTGKMPSFEAVLGFFKEFLSWERLGRMNFEKMLEKGREELKIYYDQRKDSFEFTDIVELDFSRQSVVINGIKLTGKIDKIKFLDPKSSDFKKEVNVFDLKTGKILDGWNKSVKSQSYKDQLVFYKLLIENSRDFSKYVVNEGIIEFFTSRNGEIVLLPHPIAQSEVEEMKKLIEIIYNKIINLDFPDVSRYEKGKDNFNDASVQEFRADLLAGKI